ncbi:MAG: transposase [Chloroflexota bacterium]
MPAMGAHLGYTPRYCRAPLGQRACGRAPRNVGSNRTLITSLTVAGMGAGVLFDEAICGTTFIGYVDHALAPTLRAGQVVVADNPQVHYPAESKKAIDARGAERWFLPAYSPDVTTQLAYAATSGEGPESTRIAA